MSEQVFNVTTTPTTPASGKVKQFADSADKRTKQVDDAGLVLPFPDYGWRSKNILVNGGFNFAQRQLPGALITYSNLTGRAYGADRFGLTNENASVQYQRIDSNAAVETNLNARYYGKFKKIAFAGKICVSQVVEGTDGMPYRGRVVRLQVKMRQVLGSSAVIRLGVLQLTNAGTLDTIPATFISAFNASGVAPTFGTNLALITPERADGAGAVISGSAISCTLTSSWVVYSGTFVLPINFKNIAPVIFAHNQLTINDEIGLTEVGLYDGREIRDWMPPLFNDEVRQVERFYQKSFGIDTAPVQNGGSVTDWRWAAARAAALVNKSPSVNFRTRMRSATPTLTSFNPSAANAQARDIDSLNDCSATTMFNTGDTSFGVQATGAAGTVVGNRLVVGWKAEAEL